MGRRIQRGLNYTFLPVDFFEDIKIQRLYKKTGNIAAPLVYQAFLCLIYKEGYYIRWNDDMAFIVSQKLHIDEEEVSRILDACLELDLFDGELFNGENILTSHGIQQYYEEACKKSKLTDRVREYSLISSEEIKQNTSSECISSEEKPISSEEMTCNAQFECISSEDCKERKEPKERKSTEENRKEENYYYYSSLSSLPSEKQQQEEIVFEFFMRNWAAPRKEFFDKFLPFNNTGKRRWATMDAEARKAAVKLWKQTPPQKPRFSDKFLTFWYHLFRYVRGASSYYDIVWDMLDDRLSCIENGNKLTLITTRRLMQFLEACGEHYFDIAAEYYDKINYKIINE